PSSPAAPLPCFSFCCSGHPAHLPSCPTRRSSDLGRKWAEGAAYGAALGGVLGGVIGCLVALGRVAEPDSIWLMLIVSMFAGVGLGGALGSLLGAALGLRALEYRAKLLDGSTRAGHVMIAVWVTDDARAERIRRILARQRPPQLESAGRPTARGGILEAR